MIKEFKEFAIRGNVIDMAVGIIIGGAFGKIVSSLVNDVIMPPIGLLLGNVDFSSLAITLKGKTAEAEAVTIKYGIFVNTVLDFIIVAFAIFIVIRQMNRLKKKVEAPPVMTKECPKCYSSIPTATIVLPFEGVIYGHHHPLDFVVLRTYSIFTANKEFSQSRISQRLAETTRVRPAWA
ncbi:MAG TPA: large-conductance mechanosensitive channel protein MscL [Proteobacteria bacterium]|nr:large-conductance mechanosensitive channel protein MscL [Pseudomonadota bacterium]